MHRIQSFYRTHKPPVMIGLSLIIAFAIIIGWGWRVASARSLSMPISQASPLHPDFYLLDENGDNVLDTKNPISTMQTCGQCHDTAFITTHSYHASVGLSDFELPGAFPNERPWDSSPGLFGRWNPMTYRYLSPSDDERMDLSTAEWLQVFGARHAGGGPGEYSREGILLSELNYSPDDPETNIVDPESGELVPWDWEKSGLVEMNCFLCHIPAPNNDARIKALQDGMFRWASTATLVGSGIVSSDLENLNWNVEAFNENKEIKSEFVQIQDPNNNNCGQCHGLVHDEIEVPIVVTSCAPDRWRTETTGQIVSPQKISNTGMNIKDKENLTRPWDIHAERLVACTDCHFSVNNPIYYQENDETKPDHLDFDPRRLGFGEYLQQPSHQFARGQSAQTQVAPEYMDTMRRCESCHNIDNTHDWLPYKDRHMDAISCESCHIPTIYAFAREQYDWTVIRTNGIARMECRGIEGESPDLNVLATGFDPVLLAQRNVDGETKLAPFNLITSWFWVYGDPPRPVSLRDLESVWLDGDSYQDNIMNIFDHDLDGQLSDDELVIDTDQKEAYIANLLEDLGLQAPRIMGEIQPYSINHTVATGEWATKDCKTCHSEDSKLTKEIELASYVPAGITPRFVSDSNLSTNGDIYTDDDGRLFYKPATDVEGLYILGNDKVDLVDRFGVLIFLGTLAGVVAHGGLRVWSAIRQPKHIKKTKHVYMYSVYERLWHWLQTFVIFGLILTGLIIHKPDLMGFISFRGVVLVHNVLAAILVINAFLALFYHVASGEIKQYIPQPHGFFDLAITQLKFYISGIFNDKEHPFEKSPDKKLNPLQQATYFGLLNVLLPLQVITGAMIWGAQRWPVISSSLGGLRFLSPFHTLITWLLASFIVAHVYLTTTGHSPTAAINAMMMGWDEIELSEISQPKEDDEGDNDYTISDAQQA